MADKDRKDFKDYAYSRKVRALSFALSNFHFTGGVVRAPNLNNSEASFLALALNTNVCVAEVV